MAMEIENKRDTRIEYRFDRNNELKTTITERYRRDITPELIDESQKTIYLVEYGTIQEYFGLIYILEKQLIVLQSDILDMNEQAYSVMKNNMDKYNLFYDEFHNSPENEIRGGKKIKTEERSKYRRILMLYQEKYTNKTFEILDKKKMGTLQNSLIDDLLLNPIKPVEIKMVEVEYDVGFFRVNTYDKRTGFFVTDEKSIKVINIKRFMNGDRLKLRKNFNNDIVDEDEFLELNSLKVRTLVGSVVESKKQGLVQIKSIQTIFGEFEYKTENSTLIGKKVIFLAHNSTEIEVVRVLGNTWVYEDEVDAIFEHFGQNYYKNKHLNVDVSEEVSERTYQIRKNESIFSGIQNSGLIDLTDKLICSIDPPGCVDVDDALHLEEFDDFYEIGVHIADVTHYIKEGSEIDRDAFYRATTIYFPELRIDMIPPKLSTEICSLREDKTSRAFSVIFKVKKETYEIDNVAYTKSIIKNKRAFTYEEATKVVYEGEEDEFKWSLTRMLEFTEHLKTKRIENGALLLNKGDGSEKVYHLKSLIEEMMLLANINVARKIFEYNKGYSILRKHPKPSKIAIEGYGMEGIETGPEINEFLKENKGNLYLGALMTRNLQQAYYFASGTETDYSHFGIGCDIYTHFTSPIRRYADILVHRTLADVVKFDQENQGCCLLNMENKIVRNKELLRRIDHYSGIINEESCRWINHRNIAAKRASFMANELFIAYNLNEYKAKEYVGVIAAVNDTVMVYVPDHEIEAVLIKKNRTEYKMYDTIKVQFIGDFSNWCVDRVFKLNEVS
ncbi:RRP44 [Enterospora canceri]|uniref:RRP44 n=1 Tax=Enterospora canceri TaxID=1081671 RepID=A0A1Y1S8Z9_9MICR|nr:RRP44 [Enterospora canceri]